MVSSRRIYIKKPHWDPLFFNSLERSCIQKSSSVEVQLSNHIKRGVFNNYQTFLSCFFLFN